MYLFTTTKGEVVLRVYRVNTGQET